MSTTATTAAERAKFEHLMGLKAGALVQHQAMQLQQGAAALGAHLGSLPDGGEAAKMERLFGMKPGALQQAPKTELQAGVAILTADVTKLRLALGRA